MIIFLATFGRKIGQQVVQVLFLKTFVTMTLQACHEVTTEHCVDSPKAVTTVVPLEHCHVKQVVDCVPASQTVPKTVCEPVETKHVAYHPFAYHY